MFAFGKSHHELMLFYGNRKIGSRSSVIPFRVIGTCNAFYRDGDFTAAPGDGLGCDHWHPSAADLLVMEFKKNQR